MTIKQLFVLDTFVAGLFGLGLIAIPNTLLALFGIADPGDAAQTFWVRMLGGALIGIGLTEWFARHAEMSGALPLLRGILWFDIIAAIVTLQAVIVGTANTFGLIIPALFLFFGIARIVLGLRNTTPM